MPFVSVTRLRLRAARLLPAFAFRTWRSTRQLKRAPGFLGGTATAGAGLAFWTATVWTDEAAMRAYRNADAHMRAMPKLIDWCDEASMTHWVQDDDTVPGYAEMERRMIAGGRLSKVRHPSAEHAAGRMTPGAPRGGGRIVPRPG
jgi:hypothetical protein